MRGKCAACVGAALIWAGAAATAADDDLLARAQAGDASAQFELARRYTTGARGTEEDPVEAARWFRLAAEQGDARAQTNLASLYRTGRGVERDDVEAVNWLVKAAEQRHPRAMYLLAERFAQGKGVPQSPVLAYVWMSRAASLGSPSAQHRQKQLASSMTAKQREAARRLEERQRLISTDGMGRPLPH